jgi:hypothetical protein
MYIAQGPAGIRSDLYVIDYVGATIVSLRRVEFAEYGFGFAFSPDQQRIAYYVNEPAPSIPSLRTAQAYKPSTSRGPMGLSRSASHHSSSCTTRIGPPGHPTVA